jgi:DNA mismatch repair protein MutS
MYKEYEEFYNTYTKKYGPKTAIFMMVGSFYELYDIQNIETGDTKFNVREITDLLGIQLAIKKEGCEINHHGLFAGFPEYVMHKWAGRLTSNGWTVVIIDQVKDMRGKVKERKVSRILSPSTHIENTSSTETPYIFTLFFQQQTNNPPQFGASALDLTTGTTTTYSGQASGRADIWTADDLVQMISVFQPKELLIYWKYSDISIPDEQYFRRIFGIQQSIPLHLYPVDTIGTFSKELVRSEYLQKIYNIRCILSPKTYLGLRTEYEELSLLYLLQFVEEHYPSMVKSFHRNEPWVPQARLICGNHALTQLQMTGQNLNETVIGLFNQCITPMGKRLIRERLLSPYSSSTEIRQRLFEVQDYLLWPETKQKILERQLRFMFDLPRLHRKILCGLITPQEINGLFQTYSAIKIIIQSVSEGTLVTPPFTQDMWTTYISIFQEQFTKEKAEQSSQDLTPFNILTYPQIGILEQEIASTLEQFVALKVELCKKGGIQEDALKLEEREKEPYGLKGSRIVLQQLQKNAKNLPEGIKISELKSGGWVDCVKLQQLNTELVKLREKLQTQVKTIIIDACLHISNAGEKIWSLMEYWVSHIDCTQCIGKVSKEKGFVCPTIEEVSEETGSTFDIKDIRHPLVEATATRISYVKHNIALGTEKNTAKGWLVYGMNASGKSTLMKATGLCILLAQAGCFVPAREMMLRPFQAVYTRILNQDNLFAGLSSFAVEMSELRDILRNANKYTLVLGDELCAGTESISAQALVASGIQWLSSKSAKFIFATHLHDLTKILNTQELGVDVWHLHVDYDPITKKLVYDRSLRSGSGSSMYGLEVARAMDLPFDFIEQALQNRHKIIGSSRVNETVKSNWNTNIVRKECEICKSQITSNLEVHHIIPRSLSINNILPDGTHMNDKQNLIVICEKCHDKVHNNTIEIGNIKVTSDGLEREIKDLEEKSEDVSHISDETIVKSKKSKWSEEEIKTIKETLKKFKTTAIKSIKYKLETEHSIIISDTVLGKFRKELSV